MNRNWLHHKQKKDSIVRVNKDKSMLFGKTNKIDDLLVRYIRKKDSVQFSCSVLSNSQWPHGLSRQTSLSITNSRSLHKLRPIRLMMLSSHLSLCHSFSPLPLIFSKIRVFGIGPKYWSFSFSIIPYNEYSGLISFRMDWLGLLAVQGTLKSLLQQHSSKASIIQCSAFFMVQLSPYMTPAKTIDVTRQIFVGKVMSLLFKELSRLSIAFLPRNKCV